MSGSSLSDVLQGRIPLSSNEEQLDDLQSNRGRPLLAFVLAPSVRLDSNCMEPLWAILDGIDEDETEIDLFLDTLGRAGPEAWRVVSVLRERFKGYTALVPFAASPGATQIALGADTVVMHPVASLAPLEPARLHRADLSDDADEVPMSAFDVHHYLRFLRTEFGEAPITPDSAVVQHLWQRIDPLIVGATARAHAVNQGVTRRCLTTHFDADKDAECISGILRVFSEGGLDHRFPVTARECRALGLDVSTPRGPTARTMSALHSYYDHMLGLEGEMVLGENQYYTVRYDGFIDTMKDRRVLLHITRTDERGRALSDKPSIYRWVQPIGADLIVDEELEL